MKAAYLLMTAVLASGCALHGASTGTSTDGFGNQYQGDVRYLADAAAEALEQRYPPAHTSVLLLRVPGQFGEYLESSLRRRGYAVTQNPESRATARIRYTADILPDEWQQPAGYASIQTDDGQHFSFVRRLHDEELPPATYADVSPALAEPLSPLPGREEKVTPEKESPAPSPVPPGPKVMLREGVLASLPRGWKYTIPNADKRTVSVPAASSGDWRERISVMAEAANCRASFDETARRVSLLDAPVPAPEPVRTAAKTGSENTAVSTALHEIHPEPARLPADGDVLPGEPLFSPVPEGSWELVPGSLCEQLREWTDRAGYQLIWKPDEDLRMEASVNFSGDFETAIQSLFHGLHKAGNPYRVTLYSNNVLEVTED